MTALLLALAMAAPLPRDARPTPAALRPGWVFASRDTGVRYRVCDVHDFGGGAVRYWLCVAGPDADHSPAWYSRAEIERMERGSGK